MIHPNDKIRTIALAGLLLGFAFSAAPAVADTTACNNHTDGDRRTCRDTCPSGEILHVYINLDDSSEDGEAATTCSGANAECATNNWCSDDSEISTGVSAPWTCHFEAHDVWYQPDNGFTYECSSHDPPSGGGSDCTNDGEAVCAIVFNCDGLVPQGSLMPGTIVACGGIASGAFLSPGATAGTVVRYQDGIVSGVSCRLGDGCWLARPVCDLAMGRLSCDVNPAERR